MILCIHLHGHRCPDGLRVVPCLRFDLGRPREHWPWPRTSFGATLSLDDAAAAPSKPTGIHGDGSAPGKSEPQSGMRNEEFQEKRIVSVCFYGVEPIHSFDGTLELWIFKERMRLDETWQGHHGEVICWMKELQRWEESESRREDKRKTLSRKKMQVREKR